MGIIPTFETDARACILVLGGSFDPVHNGHVALAQRFIQLLQPQELRLIPAGQPWQKSALAASAEDRIAMLKLAFSAVRVPLLIDQQEIDRAQQSKATYSIDTLRNMRAELGNDCCIVFVIGADQLHNLITWRDWQQLFELAHFCVATRPGINIADMPAQLASIWQQRLGTPEQLRHTPAGHTYLADDLALDISATQIRHELKLAPPTSDLVPPKVLDYIQQHHLYR